jgi:hypothetical protein
MMKYLLAIGVIVACVCTAGALAADITRSQNGLWVMLCTQEGVAKGFKGKELEDFVGNCVKAKASAGGKDDPPVPPEMANC